MARILPNRAAATRCSWRNSYSTPDQLALAPRVRRGDQFVRLAAQRRHQVELALAVAAVDRLEQETFGHERQPLERPALERRVVGIGRLEGREVPERPRHAPAVALEKALLAQGVDLALSNPVTLPPSRRRVV
jgi:hypothetical protein